MQTEKKKKLRPLTVFQFVLLLFLVVCLILLIVMRLDIKDLREEKEQAQGEMDELKSQVDGMMEYYQRVLGGDPQALEDWLLQNGYTYSQPS